MAGTFLVKASSSDDPGKALKIGTYGSSVVVLVLSLVLSHVFFGDFKAAIAIISGLIVGLLIGITTEYYTSGDYKPVQKIADQSETGAATTIISGLSVGMRSTMLPILFIAVGILAAYHSADCTALRSRL